MMAYYTLGDSLGAGEVLYGFAPQNIADYLRINQTEASAIMRLALKTPNYATVGLVPASMWKNFKSLPPQQQRDIELAVIFSRQKYTKTDLGGKNRLEEIQRGLYHLSQHPAGSKVSGGLFKTLSNIGLNIATGGLYQVGKGIVSVAKGGKVLPALTTAVASWGPGGGVLTPVVGTKPSLAIQSAIAGGALTAAAGAGALTPLVGKAAPLALATGTKLITATPPSSGTYPPDMLQPSIPGPGQPGYVEQGFGPDMPQGTAPVEAGLFGGLSPMMIGLLFGIPLVLQFAMKGRNIK